MIDIPAAIATARAYLGALPWAAFGNNSNVITKREVDAIEALWEMWAKSKIRDRPAVLKDLEAQMKELS